jgi:hypothetical protein
MDFCIRSYCICQLKDEIQFFLPDKPFENSPRQKVAHIKAKTVELKKCGSSIPGI